MTAVAHPRPVAAGDRDTPLEAPRRRRARVVAVAVAAALAVLAGVLALVVEPRSGEPAALVDGRRGPVASELGEAPDFALPPVREGGPQVSLALAEGRPVVLNFFASWCAPCRRELPALREAHARFGDDVAFLGVAHLDVQADAAGLLDEFSISYPTGLDPRGRVAADYLARGLPTTVFIRADGTVQEVFGGEVDAATLADQIARLTGGSPTLQSAP